MNDREESSTKRSVIAAGLLAIALLATCGGPPDPRTDDVPTRGHVLILADENLRVLVEAERFMFESIYDKATLDIRYLPEAQLLKEMLNDSVRCTIMTTRPGGEQDTYFIRRSVKAHTVPIAVDGIAVLVNKDVKLAALSPGAVVEALSTPGAFSYKGWELPEEDRPLAAPRAWFVSAGSGVARYLVDSLFGTTGQQKIMAMTVDSLPALVERIEQDPLAIGFVSFAAISDLDNPHMKALRGRVKLLPISATDTSAAVLPSQSTLADGSYPLRRPVFMVLAEGKSGLGTGFVSFVANHKGQRIILKHGLAPNKVPPREIEVVAQ